MPEAARERSAMPPAGAALALHPGVPPARILHGASHLRYVTDTVTNVNRKETTFSTPIAFQNGFVRFGS
jgi:hypothetical protein